MTGVVLTDGLSTQEIGERINKLEKKLKLSNLLTGKKFADLELTIGKLDERLKEISTDFPEIKERAEGIEDLLNVINLGIVSYKGKFDDLSSRLTGVEQIPEKVKTTLSNYEKKLNSLEDNVKKISTSLNEFKIIKEDVTKKVEENILPKIQTLSENRDINRMEIEHIKKNIDALTSAVKSFERTVELTNLDAIIKRFDSMEDKLMKTRSQMEEFRKDLSTISVRDKDVDALKQKLKETESVVLEKLGKLNEVETKIGIVQQKLEDMNYFDISTKLKSELKGKEDIISQNQARIDGLTKRLDTLSDELEKRVEEIGRIKTTQPIESRKVNLDVATTEEAYKRMETMYHDMVKRISELKGLDKELKNIELPPSLNKTISKFEERLDKLDKNYNEIIGVVEDLMKSVKEEASETEKIEGIDELRKRTKEMEKILTSWNKNITDYRKQMEERIHKIEEKKVGEKLPKNIAEEISSLKEIMSKISVENKEFKKLAREIRINQMASVEPETFANFANKVSELEKKILEVEEMSKKSTAKVERIKEVDELKKEMQGKIKGMENKISEDYISELKGLEDKIKQLEKKISEESSVKPIILE